MSGFVQQRVQPNVMEEGIVQDLDPRRTRRGSEPFSAAAHSEKELRCVPMSTVDLDSSSISTKASNRD